MQKDYKVHIPVVQELLSSKYDSLAGIECSKLKNNTNQMLPTQYLNRYLDDYYDKIRRGKRMRNEESIVFYTNY